MWAIIGGLIWGLIHRITSANLGGAIGIITGVVAGVLLVGFMIVMAFATNIELLVPAFLTALLSLFAIPILGIVGAIIGAIVKFIVFIVRKIKNR